MNTTVLIIGAAFAGWGLLALGVGVALGRMVKIADEQIAEPRPTGKLPSLELVR